MSSSILTRRDAVRASALAFTAGSYSRILGTNDKVNLGLIGAGG
ncbi:MAG TPA: gfo/Idh/MocA family oxidoreductase, partial [Solibacterales bacterium]|nr:gfo/Idh/MocA family oxidoreductase [Bryobacterales bacterium]